MVIDVDARAILKQDRVAYWLGVGALPSVNVNVLIKKYGQNGTHLNQQQAALERMAQPKVVPDAGEPTYQPKPTSAGSKETASAETMASPSPETSDENGAVGAHATASNEESAG
jgi:small subunit ribosomal protein S16